MMETTAEDFRQATVRACRYRARVWWGDELIAESTRAFRVDVPGSNPTLWFPWPDVQHDLLASGTVENWGSGTVERFDAPGAIPEHAGAVTWGRHSNAATDSKGVVLRLITPPPGLEELRGFALVDASRLVVELVDETDGGDPRDTTVKRFPTWGDAEDLLSILDVGTVVHDTTRPVVEGSQLLGQAIVKAIRQAPGRRVVSAHMMFLKAADANRTTDFDLEELTGGRTFSSLAVRILQGDRVCAAGTILLGAPAQDVVHHSERIDDVPGPYDAVPYDMGVTGRDLRVVEAAYTDDPGAPVGPPKIDAWVRFREVPADPALHAGLLAQFTGHMSIAAALRPHAGIGQIEAHRTISTAINAISISFHGEPRMNDWVLYRHHATTVADGMAHSECRVHDGDGTLIASFSVEAMIRALERPSPDARTAL